MEITFDQGKSETNLHERGFGFELAAEFDFAAAFFWVDDRFDYGETRHCALGPVHGRIYALVFTETETGIRIISFRKANKREVKRYERSR